MKKRQLGLIMGLMAVLVLAGCSKTTVSDLISPQNSVASVSSGSIEEIEAGTTYGDILAKLGTTQDVGSGMHVAVYLVDGDQYLHLSFTRLDEVCPMSGAALLEGLQSAVGIRGAVTDITAGTGAITMLVEASDDNDGLYDKASVRVDQQTTVVRNDGAAASMDQIKMGDRVEVVFDGAVAESYPVQGHAGHVRIISGTGS